MKNKTTTFSAMPTNNKVYQVFYFGLEPSGDYNGNIKQISVCADKHTALQTIVNDIDTKNGFECKIIFDKPEFFRAEHRHKDKKTALGYFEIWQTQLNQISNNIISE